MPTSAINESADGCGVELTERLGTCHICLSLSEAGEQVQGHERGHHQRPQLQGDYKAHVKNIFFTHLWQEQMPKFR
jgi:hypothetical protein